MNNYRDSTGEGIWIILCLLALLLLAGGGGFMWLRQQQAARAMDAEQVARNAAEMNLMQAERALIAAEVAQYEMLLSQAEALQSQTDAASAPSAEYDEDDAAGSPAIPELYLNQDLWQHVASLVDAASEDKVFTLDADTGEVVFGDGQHGAAPPEGTASVQATYPTSGGGTVTVFLPSADLRESRLRAIQSPDGVLHLEVVDPKPDD